MEPKMTQENKDLLYKELCARLPYKTYIEIVDEDGNVYDEVELDLQHINTVRNDEPTSIRPYLRPISSLTSEECNKLFEILDIREDAGDWLKINDINIIRLFTEDGKDFYEIAKAMDYLYSIHVDFRDELIPQGLALEAPDNMYKDDSK